MERKQPVQILSSFRQHWLIQGEAILDRLVFINQYSLLAGLTLGL
jgi:hypothetical protein